MRVLLLLAGRSRRFWPLREKTLFPICGETLLEHQIDRLRDAGCEEIILVGGAHNLKEASSLCPTLRTIEQKDLSLGMRGALLAALPEIGTGPIMIVSGNDVIDAVGHASVIAAARNSDGALLAKRVGQYFPGGYLTIEGKRITGIVEKPGQGSEPSNLVNIVAHVHNDPRALLSALEDVDGSPDDAYERALASLLPERSYTAVPYEGSWHAVKYPWHLLPLLTHLLEGIRGPAIHPKTEIHPTAVIEGNVILAEGARVLAHATVKGPCVIGPGSVIANNALVRSSSIGEQCVIGFGSEVKGSILHSHVWTHMTYIGDSVIGRNVSFGAGSVTGNFRLDEEEISSASEGQRIPTGLTKFGTVIGCDCRLGIHVSINPGVKIGGRTFVSSAVRIREDVPDGSYVTMRAGEMVIQANETEPLLAETRGKYRK